MLEFMADNFAGAFAGYKLEVVESHQRSKVDTSGTAKAVVSSFNKLGAPIREASLIDPYNAYSCLQLICSGSHQFL